MYTCVMNTHDDLVPWSYTFSHAPGSVNMLIHSGETYHIVAVGMSDL